MAFHRWIHMPDHNCQVFLLRGCLSLLAITDTCFIFPKSSFSCMQPWEIRWTSSSITKPTINTKYSVDFVPSTHTHVKRCLPYANAMQLCHCTLYHVPCMLTSTWTPYTIHYPVYHGHSCLMHTSPYNH